MQVIKRNGQKEDVFFDKITMRIKRLAQMEPALNSVDVILIAKKVIDGLCNNITTKQLDNLAAETAAALTTVHPEYNTLALRICISDLHKSTSDSYEEVCEKLYYNINSKTNKHSPLITKEYYDIITSNIEELQAMLNYQYDYDYEYFGFKALEKSYLYKANGVIIERPQHLLLRVAIGLHKDDMVKVKESYLYMAQHYFTHATPTLFNACAPNGQLSSCFLATIKDDSVDGIYETLKQSALISKGAGGYAVAIHNIRAQGSYIHGTNGQSDGIVPMLKVFNDTARYINQGGNKRKGSFANYLEPSHPDLEDWLQLKKNTGKEEQRCRDLFYGLWVPDLFMKRVENQERWSFFCPHTCPGLADVHGEQYEQLYQQYEREGKAVKTVSAQQLWFEIINTQIETGMPYMCYKDAVNRCSNQANVGTIKSSNLCTEIVEYTSAEEVAVCSLASIALPKFVKNGTFDHDKLYQVCYHVVGNLNKAIDLNKYPVKEAEYSNLRHRPMGIGIQGLADTFILLRYPFDSKEAKQLNKEILETMYYAAIRASCDLAKAEGSYETFVGSPASKGLLQYDLWNVKPSDRWDFAGLKKDIVKYGLRNSQLISLMPTATTSSILGYNECFEPFTSNIYVRRILAGEFTMINKYLVNDLIKLGLWNLKLKDKIVAAKGTIQDIEEIPADLKLLYRTVWELKMKDLIDMSADRGPFVCQSQSLNAWMAEPTKKKVTSMHFYAWKKGLKTGMYYLRTKTQADAIQFTVDKKEEKVEEIVCNMEEGCVMCSG